MVKVELCLSQMKMSFLVSNDQIDVTITSNKKIPSEAVAEVFETLDIVLQRKLFLNK